MSKARRAAEWFLNHYFAILAISMWVTFAVAAVMAVLGSEDGVERTIAAGIVASLATAFAVYAHRWRTL